MPSDSKTTDPRPAATEAAMMSNVELFTEYDKLLIRERTLMLDGQQKHGPELDEIHAKRMSIRRRLNAAAAPPSGQVCVSVEDAKKALESMGFESAFIRESDQYRGKQEALENLRHSMGRIRAALKGDAR